MPDNFFQISEDQLTALSAQWQSLATINQATTVSAAGYFQLIKEHYCQPQRAYHNLSHISALLNYCQQYQDEFDNLTSVQLAIWFHDLIYNTSKSDNEEQSAQFAVRALTELQFATPIIDKVSLMILATKKHESIDQSIDARFFLDFDLAILGADAEIYRYYSQAIRREYSWVPWFLYRRKRKQVLNNFLQRERLYFSEPLRDRFETAARQNLVNEISSL